MCKYIYTHTHTHVYIALKHTYTKHVILCIGFYTYYILAIIPY